MKKFVCSIIVAVCAVSIFLPASAFAVGDSENRAAVIIDTGNGAPKTACISFQGDSISGAEALELANAQPVFQTFGGVGRAVCALCGVGCPPDDSCLTCAGSTFWNYYQSKWGSASFTLSGIGAGASRVRDGDVEGWKFGAGQKPPYLSYNTICGIEISNEEPASPLPAQTSKQVQQESKKSPEKITQSPPATSVESKVLGKSVTRQPLAMKNSRPTPGNLSSDAPQIVGFLTLILGFSAAGYFLYRSKRSYRVRP